MARRTSRGHCALCQGAFSKAGMTRHLATCSGAASSKPSGGRRGASRHPLHLIVAGRDRPEYWMHLEVPATATLEELDSFLRQTWLECCGHLSAFTIDGESYSADPEDGDRSMTATVGRILRPGLRLLHEYDFGTTTELLLTVVGPRESTTGDGSIRILARNLPPEIACRECGKPATQICTECMWSTEGWLCAACAKKHACGEEMQLPVVNSPRVGMCGYTG
jgi:hypothetical protein